MAGSFENYLADLIPGYLRARRDEVIVMRTALASGQFGDIVEIAHRLRGTGGTYGRPQLSAIGAELESAAEASDADRVSRGLDALTLELGE